MPTVFTTIGEHQDDPDRFLLLGTDGQHYQYDLLQDTTTPVNPAEDTWVVDPDLPSTAELLG
jgi:hypothetical protein